MGILRYAGKALSYKADLLAVEAVIGEPCSTELPENSEFTGNFLFFGALSDSDTSGKPRSEAVSTRLPDQMQ